MTSLEGQPIVGLLAGPSSNPERAFRKWDETIQHLHAQGVQVALLNEGVDLSGYTANAATLLGDNAEQSVIVEEARIGSIRDYTGRLGVASTIPTLNHQALITLAANKDKFSQAFPGLTAQSLVTTTNNMSEVEAFTHNLPGSEVVIKPARGESGRDVIIVPKQDALETTYRLLSKHDNVLVQELMDTSDMYSGLMGMTEEDKAKLKLPKTVQELRFFSSNDFLIPVLRVSGEDRILGGKSQYNIYLDPESVPEEAYKIGRTVIRGLLTQTKQREVHGALDLVYQRREDTWKIMEMNVKEPGLPKRKDNHTVADQIKGALAEQLKRMATIK